MSTLREIKDRIASVRSTLKITSAMKLVSSSKLRKAQNAIESLRPYELALSEILGEVSNPSLRGISSPGESEKSEFLPDSKNSDISDAHPFCRSAKTVPPLHRRGRQFPRGGDADYAMDSETSPGPTAVVALSSNSSLCGGFNANVVKRTLEVIRSIEGEVVVYCVGRKVEEAVRKAGYSPRGEWQSLVGKPSYAESAALSRELCEAFDEDRYSRVLLVYNHFVSTSKQVVTVEEYLGGEDGAAAAGVPAEDFDYIVEPGREEVIEALRPQVLNLKFHAAVLDSVAAEHAARTIAMQTATDNAKDLLSELTLEYNKGRQQKITSEILDLVSGSLE